MLAPFGYVIVEGTIVPRKHDSYGCDCTRVDQTCCTHPNARTYSGTNHAGADFDITWCDDCEREIF